ncbi:hypothetical protein CANTEDRAFT_114544 [Yamadazyma tenuis ATCC 10573]|uniref:Uncharacterized protein n=2 Tax=Candida tenuis TaxID=2315449 RepID=G3B5J6_CANTC|nr:uncharacterized protein CANTEDRAFT_114544 [Yamadazyma tenuis ATCC 10573]EGV63245.1 hypothetical protein CANTEDRAFT_114544 [Yamadazyma tenuis ATCC 10573]
MELIANVSGFFKSVGSLFTGGSPSKSLTDVSINVSAERVQTDGSETENSEKDLSLYSPSRLVHHLPVKAPHSIGLNLTQLFETFKEDSFQF